MSFRGRLDPEPQSCGGCGIPFRAEYTRGHCPVCDWAAPSDDIAARLPARLQGPVRMIRQRWAVVLLGVAVAGNIAVLVVVSVATGSR